MAATARSMLQRGWVMVAAGVLALGTVGCGVETVVHGLEEREANLIIEILADHDIDAQKGMVDTGREIHYSISVPGKKRLDAIRVLNQNELPRRMDRGYNEIFAEGGLIPTSAEERARKLAAIEGEIERQLKLVEGILDVQVQIVMPEESALRTTKDQQIPTTASVTVRYLPGAGGSKPLSEPQIQAVVAAGVEKLTPDRVVVVMAPVGGRTDVAKASAMEPIGRGKGLKRLPSKTLNAIGIVAVLLILFLSIGLALTLVNLQSVRKRLMRLQSEIARARRRGGEGTAG